MYMLGPSKMYYPKYMCSERFYRITFYKKFLDVPTDKKEKKL